MAEIEKYTFTHKELAEIFVKRLEIHEGIWGLLCEFGLKAVNLQSAGDYIPAAVVPLLRMGLQKFDTESLISVDAAKVNPRPRAKTKKGGRVLKKKK